jgi:hypothetical protein
MSTINLQSIPFRTNPSNIDVEKRIRAQIGAITSGRNVVGSTANLDALSVEGGN